VVRAPAALDYVCKQIPTEKDSHDIRERVADGITLV
jgi:hypothetical protein